MDFFKSVFVADSDPSDPENSPSGSPKKSPESVEQRDDPEQHEDYPPVYENPSSKSPSASTAGAAAGGIWSFGGLIKTITTKSESVIQTYRRDLEEFSSGLKKETALFREAVKGLPGSLEAGASVAQESLESVGQAIDEFGSSVWRGTTEIISQGKDALLADQDSDSSDVQNYGSSSRSSIRYSRFEAQVHALQYDANTFCEDPEDLEDFENWKAGFSLEEKAEEIESLCGENGIMDGMYGRLVPSVVSHETFWFRYFYKVHKLKQVEDARANLVKRVISREDEEELSWEVDDEEEEISAAELNKNKAAGNPELEKKAKDVDAESVVEKQPIEESEVKSCSAHIIDKGCIAGTVTTDGPDDNITLETKIGPSDSASDDSAAKSDEKTSEGKVEPGESSKDSDFSVVSSQRSSHEEDDLGWDEIEDLDSNDEKKANASESPKKIDLRKRLSVAEEEEDLTWDIEEDEPVKK